MNQAIRIFAVLFVMAALLFAWILRIEARSTSDNMFTITDHWSGNVYSCVVKGGCQRVYPQD